MGKLQILRPVRSAPRLRQDVIKARPLFLPERGMGHLKPVARHRPATKRTEPALLLPQRLELRRLWRGSALAHSPAGTAQPRRAQAASTVLRKRQAIVIGPTPPGTGVMNPATSAQLS